jgi:cytochrome c556
VKVRRSLSALLVLAIMFAAPAAAGQDWVKHMMKKVDRLAATGRGPEVAAILNTVGMLGAPEMTEWESIAQKGAAAAKRGDMANARAACKNCHEKYRDAYKAKYGSGNGSDSKRPKPVD